MEEKEHDEFSDVITRRQFLQGATSAAAAGALYLGLPGEAMSAPGKSRVILIRDERLLDTNNAPRPQAVQAMLDQAVAALLGEKEPKRAWGRLFSSRDVVGVKTNEWKYLATPQALEIAIRNNLLAAGVANKNISIKDRGIRDDDVFKRSTALINVRPLRTHNWSGVGSLIKNYIMFSSVPFTYHFDSCANLAKIWQFDEVKGKTRLNVLVLFTPLFHGIGPHHYNKQYVWPYLGMLVGTDPVAVDSTGVRILQNKRREFFGEERPINPPPKHVFLADTRHHLGTADPAKIELVKLGWQKDILI